MIATAELSTPERLLILLRVEQSIARAYRLEREPAKAALAEALAEETAAQAKRLRWPLVWHLSEREIAEILREQVPGGTAEERVEQAIRLVRELGSEPFYAAKEERLRRMK